MNLYWFPTKLEILVLDSAVRLHTYFVLIGIAGVLLCSPNV
jgi:hypothetical protein